MKTLLLSNDDIQNFSKLIYDPKTAQQLATDAGQAASCNLMALQYYLKHPTNYPATAPTAAAVTAQIHHITSNNSGANNNNNNSNSSNNHYSHNQSTHHHNHHPQSALLANLHQHHQQQTQTAQHHQHHQHSQHQTAQHQQPPPPPQHQHPQQQQQQQHSHHRQQPQQQQQHHHHQQQHLLAQSQSQLKQLQLKQPTIHQHHANSTYLQHHPYYQQPVPISIPTPTSAVPVTSPAAPATRTIIAPAPVPVHALNQNSNFSAASSSTGGTGTGTTTTTATGTTTSSKNAPTQQSNTTVGSSLSPAAATATRTSKSSSSSSTGGSNSVYGKVGGGGGSGSSGHASGNSSNVRTSIVSGTKRLKTEPILSQFHQTERYTFANTHLVWNEENWRRVVFQDERKFNLDGPDGFTYYFHDLRNYERTLSQRPRGNSVYIYFIITAAGPIHLEVSTSKLRPETCIETILRERGNIVEKLGGIGSGGNGGDFVLQDHNWSVNALPSAQNWLSVEGIKTQKWPTIAHDLNIMENIWGWLIREVYDGGRKFSRKDDLIFRIREAWSRLPLDLVQNLYSTLPERITELYYTRGVYTNC